MISAMDPGAQQDVSQAATPELFSAATAAKLAIPTERPSFAKFTEEVREALEKPDTHFYIDTSFLIWMTTLGKSAREEFVAWIDQLGRARFHVPVWSGHEYLTHHVRGLIGDSLTQVSGQLRRLADDTYFFLRPFLDEPPVRGGRTPQEAQTTAREVFVNIKKLANELSDWTKENYQDHFSAVASLIGELGLPGKPVFKSMKTIDVLEKNRFSGRIPPGFQDRRKSERKTRLEEAKGKFDEEVVGHNRFGDLVFWQEVLAHSKGCKARTIIVMSNDRKNDWHMGGQANAEIEADLKTMRKSWDPIPEAHPMLALEAATNSGVEKVLLIDSPYLAAFFHETKVAHSAFISAALTVELPEPPRSLNKQKRKEYQASIRAAGVADRKSRFHAGLDLQVENLSLQRYFTSRKALPEVEAFLSRAVEGNAVGAALTDFLEGGIGSMSAEELVRVARGIHDRAIASDPVASAFVGDLPQLLAEMATSVATCFYFGLLCSVYFTNDNAVRLPPSSLVLDELAARVSEPYSRSALQALNAIVDKRPNRPIYVLSSDGKPIIVKFIVREELVAESKLLAGIMIDAFDVLTPAQGEETLRFGSIFDGRNPISGSDLASEACKLFGLPRSLIANDSDIEQEFEYEASTGFEDPSILINSKD